MERTLNAEDVILLRQREPGVRVRVAHRLAGATFAEIAARVGISPTHLRNGSAQRQRLSLRVKLQVARIFGIPAAVLWPELEVLALEALHGAAGGQGR
jgi:hypothetical protein